MYATKRGLVVKKSQIAGSISGVWWKVSRWEGIRMRMFLAQLVQAWKFGRGLPVSGCRTRCQDCSTMTRPGQGRTPGGGRVIW